MNAATQIETVATASADQPLFAPVPETTLPDGTVVPAFQVAKYLSGQDDAGKMIVSESVAPWVEINYHDAKAAAVAAGLQLITETQWLAIAHDIASQDINWTGGKVGEGSLFQGLRKWTVEEAQAGDFVSPDPDERRWFELSNGARIYDFPGNAFSWVFDDVQGDDDGLIAKPFAAESPSLATAPYPSMEKGMGYRPIAGSDWSGDALVRGGCWYSYGYAGAFGLLSGWPVSEDDNVGFRCTK